MKKSNTHAKNGAILVGLVNCTTNVVLQLDEMGKNPDLKFDFWRMTVATFKGAAIGGIGGVCAWLVYGLSKFSGSANQYEPNPKGYR